MKLNLFLVSAVVAKNETGFTKPKRKGNEVRSNPDSVPETCEATFLNNNASYGSVLDIGNSGTSGYIDMHDYPDNANCFIEVVADSNCLEITTQVIHAGLENAIDWEYYDVGCQDYNDMYLFDHDACCQWDRFWFNDEEHTKEHSCGCKGDNLEFGKGCNDHLFQRPKDHQTDYEDYFDDMKDHPGRGFDDRIFNSNSFKLNFVSDHAWSRGNLRIEWSCTKMGDVTDPITDVAPSVPSDPEDRLDQLVQFSAEVLDNFFTDKRITINHWKKRFTKNAERLKKSYQRCGEKNLVVDAKEEWAAYDKSDGAKAMKDVTTGIRKWAETYIPGCPGHKKHSHHVKRMNKWNKKFQNL